jgi:hypothetical protein
MSRVISLTAARRQRGRTTPVDTVDGLRKGARVRVAASGNLGVLVQFVSGGRAQVLLAGGIVRIMPTRELVPAPLPGGTA